MERGKTEIWMSMVSWNAEGEWHQAPQTGGSGSARIIDTLLLSLDVA